MTHLSNYQHRPEAVTSSSYALTYFINTLDWGGAQTGMARLLLGLDEDVFDVTIVCFRVDDEDFLTELPDHVDIVELGVANKFQVTKLIPLVPVLRETDVLVCSMYHSSLVGTVLGTLLGVPAIFRWQHMTRIKNRWRWPFHRLTARLSSRVLADCAQSGELLEEELGISSQTIEVLTLAGLDPDAFAFPEQDVTDSDRIEVGVVARLQEVKNLGAIVDLASHFDATEYRFYIVGDGPERESLERRASDVASIELLGQLSISEVQRFLHEIDIYVQPSLSEGLCITVLEAMASGLPVIASPVGGISQSVVDGETGYFVDPEDIDGYRERVAELASDDERRREMGTAGRQRIVEQYSKERLATDFTRIVEQVLSTSDVRSVKDLSESMTGSDT